MKKIKFLAMALAALTVFSCSKDEAKNNGGTPPVVEGVETYATFNFNIEGDKPAGPTTKGATGTDANKTDPNIEAKVKNVRIVIFNDADLLEADKYVSPATGTLITTPLKLTSGTKKIFLLVNADPDIIPTFADKSPISSLYGKLMFLSKDKSDPSATDPSALNVFTADRITGGPYDAGTPNGGFFMSNDRTAEVVKVLVPGITSDQSKNGGPEANHFTFSVKRGVAKANVKLKDVVAALDVNADVNGTSTKVGRISDVKCTFRNINKALRPVQLFNLENIDPIAAENAIPVAAYFNTFDAFSVKPIGTTVDATNLADKRNFVRYYDRSFDFDQVLATDAASKYVYISENTNNKQVIGNTTYLAVEAVYSPVQVVLSCTYDPAGDGEFVPKYDNPVAKSTFYKINLAGLLKIGGSSAFQLTNNLFSDRAVATKTLEDVLTANDYKKGGTAAEQAAFTAEFNKRFSTYTGGKSYYRLNVGNIIKEGPNKGQINYGIRRNSQYQITINSFKQLGVATPGELDDNPEVPVSSQGTYVTATIVVAGWEEYTQNGDL